MLFLKTNSTVCMLNMNKLGSRFANNFWGWLNKPLTISLHYFAQKPGQPFARKYCYWPIINRGLTPLTEMNQFGFTITGLRVPLSRILKRVLYKYLEKMN